MSVQVLRLLLKIVPVALLAAVFALLPAVAVTAQEKVERKRGRHGRGHKLPPKHISAARHRVSNAKYAHLLKALPVATQATYDAYAAAGGSVVPPIGDQGQCGNCYNWSGNKVASAAQMTAGVVPKGSGFMLSVQWTLDNHPELGGCNGGDEYAVAQVIQSGGCPSVNDYPGAGQEPGQPKPTTGLTLYTVSSIVYCDPTQEAQGVASTQSVKNCVLAYGYVSVAVAAGDPWDNYTNGTLTDQSNQIDHAVGITGWDDTHDNGDGTKGAWLVDNQWGTTWGIQGRCWIKYGAESVGTEAFVTLVTSPNPPTPTPTPVPPSPTPTPVTTGWNGTVTYTNGVVTAVTPAANRPVNPISVGGCSDAAPTTFYSLSGSCSGGSCGSQSAAFRRQGLFGRFRNR